MEDASVISWEGWRAAPVPGPAVPFVPRNEEEPGEQREVTPGAGAVIHREPAGLMSQPGDTSTGTLCCQRAGRVRAVLRTGIKCLLFYLEPAEIWP